MDTETNVLNKINYVLTYLCDRILTCMAPLVLFHWSVVVTLGDQSSQSA